MHSDEASAAPAQSGLTVIEMLVALAVGMAILLAAHSVIDWSRRTYVRQSTQAEAQAVGRVAVDLFTSDLRMAGYNPMGVSFVALPAGDANHVRFLADLDADGIVGTATETDENLTYEFSGPDASGLYELHRGIDLNGDGDFTDTGESFDILASNVVPVDIDADSSPDPFIVYDGGAPPASERVILSFGIRSRYRDVLDDDQDVVAFHSSVAPRATIF